MTGRRRRRDRARLVVWAAWGLVVVLLGGNLAAALASGGSRAPQGFVTPEILQTAGFWAPLALAAAMALAGLFWASRAYAIHERSSLLWARRGYLFTLAASAALAFACLDPEFVPRAWFAVLAAAALGGQAYFFGMIAFREYRRAQSGEAHRASRNGAAPPSARDTGR